MRYALNWLLSLSPDQFEAAVAELLRGRGYGDVRRVGGSGDLGVDLLCRDRAGALVAVQCKRYAPERAVGSPAIQTFFGMVVHHGAERGLFATTSSYTKPARQLAALRDIELLDGGELAEWFHEKWERERREREEVQRHAREVEARQVALRPAPVPAPSSLPTRPPMPVGPAERTRFPWLPLSIMGGLLVILALSNGAIDLGSSADNEPRRPGATTVFRAANSTPTRERHPATKPPPTATSIPLQTPRLTPTPEPTRAVAPEAKADGAGRRRVRCDPAYPTLCIPPRPPVVDCGITTARNFPVLPPDPHRLDHDGDGIGCEPIR